MNPGAEEPAADRSPDPGQVLEPHIHPRLLRVGIEFRIQRAGLALFKQPEHAPVPAIVLFGGDAILFDGDGLPEHGARQPAHADDRHFLVLGARRGRGDLRHLHRRGGIVVEIVGRHHQRVAALGIEQPGGDDGAAVDRKLVVVDALGGDPGRPGGGDAGMRQLRIDGDVECHVAVIVPVLIDMDAGQPRPRLPERVEHRDPLGRIQQQHIRPRHGERPGGAFEAGDDRSPWRVVGPQEVQGKARHQEGGNRGHRIVSTRVSRAPATPVSPAFMRFHSMTALPVPMTVP